MNQFISRCLFLVVLTQPVLMPVDSYSYPISESVPQLIAQQTPSTTRQVRSFFETGRLASEDRLLFQKPPDGVIPVRENSNSWQFVVWKAQGASFWMPPGVLSQEKVTLETSLGPVTFDTLASNGEDRRYIVAYADSLTKEQLENPQAILKAIQEKAAPEKAFKLTNNRSITLDNHSGKELTYSGKEETIIIRAYRVGERFFVLGVRYPSSSPQERQTRAFLNAFQLIPPS